MLSTLATDGDSIPLLTIAIPTNSGNCSLWCGTWDYNNDMPIFGRLIRKNTQNVILQHWTQVLSSHTLPLTPASAPLQLIECRGCSLHESLTAQPSGRGRHITTLVSYPCLMHKPYDEVVDLSSHQISRQTYTRTDVHTLRTTFAQATSNILQSLGIDFSFSSSLAPQISGLLSLTPHFIHDQFKIDLSLKIRSFLKDLFDAINFNSLLNLSRWSHILFYH